MPEHFSWLYSLLNKAAILSAGVICLLFIGWPVSETRNSLESNFSLPKPSLADESSKAGALLHVPDDKRYFRGSRVNLNHGALSDFERLPGIGIVLAQRIIDHRQTHGDFQTVNALDMVPGIGEARIARLRPLVTVNQDIQHEKVIGSLPSASSSATE